VSVGRFGAAHQEDHVAVMVERTGMASLPRPGRFSALVVAGQSQARESVARTLRGLGAREVVVAAGALEGRLRARAMGPRELCVAEVGLPDGSGIGLLHDLKTQGWARTVVISATSDPYTVRAALAAGVRALVVAGRAPVATPTRPTGSEGLSGREVEVLQLVAEGRSNKEIGTALGLSALTVKSHLARIARKLGTGDRAELVMISLRSGLIT
jgi:DNA-binding NarL/FixJ family response regulator